jgi:hypothetical protein
MKNSSIYSFVAILIPPCNILIYLVLGFTRLLFVIVLLGGNLLIQFSFIIFCLAL